MGNVFHIVDTVYGETVRDGITSRKGAREAKLELENAHREANDNRPVKSRYKVYMNGNYIH